MTATELATLVLVVVVAATAWQLTVSRRAEQYAFIAEPDAELQTSEPESMSKHDGEAAGAVTVAELLEREAEAGNGLRLNWAEGDTDPRGMATVVTEDWPTCVLPQVEVEPDGLAETATQSALAGLPIRKAELLPEPFVPVYGQRDPELLRRILEGLKALH